jgi:phosphonate transport system substrate-binding protein
MSYHSFLRAGLVCATLFAVGCDKKTSETAADTSANTTAEATTEDAPKPSGPAKYIIGFEPQQDRAATEEKGKKLAAFLTEKSGISIGVYIPKESGDLVEAMQKKKAHMAYLSAWPYVAAHLNADAALLVVEERDGKTTYDSALFVQADSQLKSTSDLKGKKLAFTSPTSTSGYLFPMMKLIEDGVVERDEDLAEHVESIILTGGYENSLRAVIAGDVDVAAAAAYAPEVYLSEEDQAKVKTLATHGPVPTHVIAIRSDVPLPEQEKLREAFLALNEGDAKKLLKDVYGAEKLVVRSHGDHVYKLQQQLEELDVDYPVD